MKSLLWPLAAIFLLLVSSPPSFSGSICAQQTPTVERFRRGMQLFQHQWEPREFEPDDLSSGDGLGPLFNRRSCAGCHHQGGNGGAGFQNVQLLTVVPREPINSLRDHCRVRNLASEIHPGFTRNSNTVVLHRFSTNPRYESFRDKLLGIHIDANSVRNPGRLREKRIQELRAKGPVIRIKETNLFQIFLTERNTPSLFGLHLIDSVPDDLLHQLAADQEKRSDGISGRVSTVSTAAGKFGWRGQMETVRDFVLTACAVELGLQVTDRRQEMDPLSRRQIEEQRLDLTFQEQEELIAFVESLSAPGELPPRNIRERNQLKLGESAFRTLNCNVCHVPNLGAVRGIYSDLLLHDMGDQLADPSPALPRRDIPARINFGGYLGGQRGFAATQEIDETLFREWRTPPLWGIRDTAPYMHDGRAANLDQAIRMHGGESERSRESYLRLPQRNRQALLQFLNSLGTPLDDPG